jgi:hypothetical protein
MRDDEQAQPAASGRATVPLGRLRRYKVADGDPDVRGWQVYGNDGQTIGQVDDLLVDPDALKVRYLQIRLARRLLDLHPEGGAGTAVAPAVEPEAQALPELDSLRDLGGTIGMAAVPGVPPTVLTGGSIREHLVRETLSDLENQLTADHHLGHYHYAGARHILLPVGKARLDTQADRVLVDGLSAEDALRLPPFEPGTFDRGFEEMLLQALDGTWHPEPERDLYEHALYDEVRFYQSRRGRAEAVLPGVPGVPGGSGPGRR